MKIQSLLMLVFTFCSVLPPIYTAVAESFDNNKQTHTNNNHGYYADLSTWKTDESISRFDENYDEQHDEQHDEPHDEPHEEQHDEEYDYDYYNKENEDDNINEPNMTCPKITGPDFNITFPKTRIGKWISREKLYDKINISSKWECLDDGKWEFSYFSFRKPWISSYSYLEKSTNYGIESASQSTCPEVKKPDFNFLLPKSRAGAHITTITVQKMSFLFERQCLNNTNWGPLSYKFEKPSFIEDQYVISEKYISENDTHIFWNSPNLASTELNINILNITCPKTKDTFLNITFPETKLGEWAMPLELCPQKNYSFGKRQCLDIGIWGLIYGNNCSKGGEITNTTQIIHKIFASDHEITLQDVEIVSEKNIFKNDTYILWNSPNLAETDSVLNITCPKIRDPYFNITFPETKRGEWAMPIELCLQKNYSFVKRQCLDMGIWGPISGNNCSKEGEITNTTQVIYTIFVSDSETALQEIKIVTEKLKETFKPKDIYLISQILDKASTQNDTTNNFENFMEIVNNIMSAEEETLKSAQNSFKATDTILYSLDKLILQTHGTKNFSSPLILMHTIKIKGDLTGVMIKNNGAKKANFTSFEMIPLHNEDELQDADFEIAFITPPNFTQKINYYYSTLFYNNSLFNSDRKNNDKVGSWIISILFPENSTGNNHTLKIYFKELKYAFQEKCSFWNYSNTVKGNWAYDADAVNLKSGYYICEFNHTTHFGMLISDSAPENLLLDLITIFGTILSLIGIAVIFITALTFKNWSSNPSNKIILNVSLCLLFVIILFFISDRISKGPLCIITGIFLHYMILAQFCWMLIISYSNYRRLRLGLHYHIENVVLKYCFISWGIPLIAVGCTAGISLETYDKNSYKNVSQICYPKGNYLKFGLMLPAAIILSINFIVYIRIIRNLTSTGNIRKHINKKSYSGIKSMILLFFMMGITWIFGFLAEFTRHILFEYIFCVTSTCQGFVIFLFYILDATNTRQLWRNKIRNIKKRQRQEKTQNLLLSSTKNSTETSVE